VATKLLEHAADFAEFGAELRAQARQDGDERDRDQRSDQRILDSRGARLVADERFEGIDQHDTCSILLMIFTRKQIVPANFFRVNPIGEYADFLDLFRAWYRRSERGDAAVMKFTSV
jgi:hypothetical protein